MRFLADFWQLFLESIGDVFCAFGVHDMKTFFPDDGSYIQYRGCQRKYCEYVDPFSRVRRMRP
jgi:hypothetical protein